MNGNTVLRATEEKKVVLSAEGADIYLRPNGSTTDDGQLRITTQGEAYLDGRRMATVEDIPEPAPVPADYIIEQGDTGAYGYIKWASGRFEAWRTSTSSVSVNINSSLYGQMYYGTEEQSVTTSGKAAQFVKIHDVQLTLLTVPGMAYPVLRSLSVTDTGAAKATYYVANPLKATITVTPKVHFIGTWK
jgi:hypothetical protein